MGSIKEELKVNISLGDRLSLSLERVGSQLEKINKQASEFQEKLRGNFDGMMANFSSAIAVGNKVYTAISPGVELQRALNSVGGFGLEGDLDDLRSSAQSFSKSFGMDSTEFVENAGLIKRAIGDVNAAELGDITTSITKLASSTHSDVAKVSDYLGRLYHTYQDQADKIGKVKFFDQLANMNAVAARSFGISAESMAGTIESISSLAKNYSISIPEQLAVMGTLRNEFSESNAVSYYKAFIRDSSKLKDLGINTLDDKGQMRSMLDILAQVKSKFGDVNGLKFQELDGKAGDTARVIQTLLRQQDKFKKALGEMSGPGTAALDQLADANTDVLKQLSGSWATMRENFSQAIMPVVNTVASCFIGLLDSISSVTSVYPNLTAGVLTAVVALTALVAIISAGSGMLAMMRTAAAAMGPSLSVANGLFGSLTLSTEKYTLATMFSALKTKTLAAAQWALNAPFKATLYSFGAMASVQEWLTGSYTAMTAAMRGMTLASLRQAVVTKMITAGQAALNVVMSLNPLGLLVVGLVAAGVMIMRYWQPIQAFFSGFIDGLRASGLFDAFAPLAAVFGWIWDKVKAIGAFLFGWLSPIEYASDELSGFADIGKQVGQMLGTAFTSVANFIIGLFQPIVDLLNAMGMDIELPTIESHVSAELSKPASPVPSAAGAINTAVAGSKPALAAINPAQSVLATPTATPIQSEPSQNIRTTQYGNINVYPQTPVFSLLDLDEKEILTIG